MRISVNLTVAGDGDYIGCHEGDHYGDDKEDNSEDYCQGDRNNLTQNAIKCGHDCEGGADLLLVIDRMTMTVICVMLLIEERTKWECLWS